ncbi:response regulator [Mesonia aestuariivivens]|uniref:Response regulator n=1 Tax=Mesonia aestuariivivens TaxID=2796128 RepID=A0ABS6VXT9_9FLAO|nr:response regulator [Mesonia aestuariivivens]MBW2960398.1 response regulator [Mesonia aestuariivivens]
MEICIVDDDKVYQLLTKKLIQRIDENISIKTFFNGEDAYKYFSENQSRSNVLLLDINMPKMNGWEFLEHLEQDGIENANIYLATSSIAYSDLEKAKQYNSLKGYLIKPITKEKLLKITQLTKIESN